MMIKTNVVIIGAGIGGIAAAARLAKNGFQVTVLEKNAHPGGRCGQMVKDGHYFDTGPTLFLMPEYYAQTFTDLGERMEDHLDLRRVDPTYFLFFKDGSKIRLTSDLNAMKNQLERIEPGSFGAYLRYLNEGLHHYNLSLKNIGNRDFRNLLEFANLRNLMLLFKVKGLTKHYNNIGKYFDDDRLKAAFTFQNMYMGLSPYQAPATFSLLPYSELADGVWFPVGGMYRVIKALTGIAIKWGVKFEFNAPVKKINITDKRATGVTLADGQQFQADYVVANADLPYVYANLLPSDRVAKKLDRKEYSCSTITLFWGLDKQYPQLGAHNIFFAEDYRRCFEEVSLNESLPEDPLIYVHAPSRIDPSLAPEGQDTLIAVIPVCHIKKKSQQDWDKIRTDARQCVLQRLAGVGITNLDQRIKLEMSYTPPAWKKLYNLVNGSTHGLGHNLTQMAYFRPRNQHARYRNLYFVGASTHPGTGLPAVLVSARLATERILQAGKHTARAHYRLHSKPVFEKILDFMGEDRA